MTATRQIDTVSFPVEGMTCAACVNRITRFLANVDGVESATVNLATETATVRFDPGLAGDRRARRPRSRRPATRRAPTAPSATHARPSRTALPSAPSGTWLLPETSRRCAAA